MEKDFTKNERRMIKSDIKFDDDEITIGELIKQQEKQLNEEELLACGIKPNTIRLSIGTEHIDDIIQDLEEAFKAVK